MNQKEMDDIVELITRKVMSQMGASGCAVPSGSEDGIPKVLYIGSEKGRFTQEMCRNCSIYDISDYKENKNILRYSRVLIAELCVGQMTDIALARFSCPECSAVLEALMNGIEVIMADDALDYKKYAGKGSNALYEQLDGYAKRLQIFGIKVVGLGKKETAVQPKPAKYGRPATPAPAGSGVRNSGQLITEADAVRLVKLEGPVQIPAGSILTPSAKDVFIRARKEIVRC